MIHELLKKYKLLKIKYQIIIDIFNFFSIYSLFLILLIISEMTFYHSSMIRYQFYLIIIGLPFLLTSYILIKSLINVKGFNTNMNDFELC